MYKFFSKSMTFLLRRPTPATTAESTQLPQLAEEPTDNLQRQSWRSVEGMVRCSANYVPLSPISFLERSADVYRNQTSVIYGSLKYTWEETHTRCVKLASSLTQLGVSPGDIVATLAPNVPALQELHFAIPMAGAIICSLNIHYDSNMLATILTQTEAKILAVDHQLLDTTLATINLLKKPPLLVIISDAAVPPPHDLTTNVYDYETLIDNGDTGFSIVRPTDEWDPISISYTSGTTSRPKGVVYSHRGAYLNTIASLFLHGVGAMPTYLWSVPMFHCNGWCMAWGLAAVGGTNICLRRCDPKEIFDNIVLHKVTHMGGAPAVLNMIVNSPESDRKPLPHQVHIITGGAPPPPLVLSKMEELGFKVSHLYGLTESFGPGMSCLWKPEWDSLPIEEQLKLKTRQGVKHFMLESVDVKDPVTMESVKCDGKSIGEIMFRGNTIMSGYFKDTKATEEAFMGGWFRSGDLAVKHPDGYIEVKDRSKDIIISGDEIIGTVEVETVIYNHPAVLEVAVVARPDNHWGQTPCAFVKLKEGFNVNAQDIIDYCRDRMPHYMAPKTIIFEDLPRTSTGKVQKFLLREKAKALGSIS